MIRKPFGKPDEEVITAIDLLAYLGDTTCAEDVTHLLRDRDLHVRTSAARAIADLGYEKAIPMLAETVDATDEARWSLIRLGAADTIVKIIERGVSADDVRSVQLVRAYLDHWRELPGPLNERIIAAVRKAHARTEHRTWLNYYEAFLELVETEPPPPGDVLCRINQSWNVLRNKPVRLIHGWYTIENG